MKTPNYLSKFRELQELGFTKSELLVYIALLKLGQSSTGKIVKEADISSGKIYEVLNKLIEKGLASYIVKNNVKYFSAAKPSKIKEYINKKKREFDEKLKTFQEFLPKLEEISKKEYPEYIVKVYEGFEGFKTAFLYVLDNIKNNSENVAMGVGMENRTKAIEFFYEKIKTIYKQKNLKTRFIVSDLSEDSLRFIKKFPAKIRYLGGFNLAPLQITEDFVMIYNFEKLSIILIKNKTIAEQFRFFFNSLWKISKNKPPESQKAY